MWAGSEHAREHACCVECHGKIAAEARRFPGCYLSPFVEVDDSDLISGRHINECPTGRWLDLKSLWMPLKGGVADLGARCRIDDGQTAIAIADDQLAVARIDANIIGVAAQTRAADRRTIHRTEKSHGAIAGIRGGNQIFVVRIGDALWIIEATDVRQRPAVAEINDFDGVVSQRGDNETLSGPINRHMIDTPADARQWDCLRKKERFRFRCRHGRCRQRGEHKDEQTGGPRRSPLPARSSGSQGVCLQLSCSRSGSSSASQIMAKLQKPGPFMGWSVRSPAVT